MEQCVVICKIPVYAMCLYKELTKGLWIEQVQQLEFRLYVSVMNE